MSLKPIITLMACSSLMLAHAQESFKSKPCLHKYNHTASKTTVASAAEDQYDVKYVKLNLAMNNTSVSIVGDVLTTAKVVASGFSSYVFELNPELTLDSVLINGVTRTASRAGNIVNVAIGRTLPIDTLFSAQIFYRGTPTSGTASSIMGINNISSPSWGNRVTFTLSEPYDAYKWWPCKQSLRDKIDSSDIWITVPDSLKAGSNGVLSNVTTLSGNKKRFEWKERYPIDYYLISVSIANYVDYSYYLHFTGSTDSMLVQNYIYNNSGTLPRFRPYIDSTGMMIDYFSKLFGRYRFWKEKYGHCMAPLSGGMEHQTMSTVGFFSGGLTSHELGHQWFGDNATCGSWSDIFINEGFASYCEYLYIDRFNSHAGALADIDDRQTNVKTIAGGKVFTLDTSAAAVFSSRLSYDKGACVIHMLRFVINNDSLFFNTLKQFQNQYTDSTATVQDFQNVVTTSLGPVVNGMNIDTFFQQWIYLEGFPEYTLRYNQNSAGQVLLAANQAGSVASSVPYFITPLEVKFRSATGDTVVRFFNNSPSQIFSFNWNKTVTSVVVDPEKWLLYRLNSLTKDTTLSVDGSYTSNLVVSPNPTTQNWELSAIPAQTQLMLYDIQGKLIWNHLQVNKGNTTIDSEGLPAGIYLLQAINSGSSQTMRLLKQ